MNFSFQIPVNVFLKLFGIIITLYWAISYRIIFKHLNFLHEKNPHPLMFELSTH